MKLTSIAGLLILATGCAAPLRPTVDIETDIENSWVTPEDLDRVVQRFVAEKQLHFDFRGLTPHIVVPHSRDYLAEVWYGKGIGFPTLTAKVSVGREVIDCKIGMGVCGHLPSEAEEPSTGSESPHEPATRDDSGSR